MLCRRALVLQEYDYQIKYQNGANADTLSRITTLPCTTAVAMPLYSSSSLCQAQLQDGIMSQVLQARKISNSPPRTREWNTHPLRRYRQLWAQLKVVDGVLCRTYTPLPLTEERTVSQQTFAQMPYVTIMIHLLLDTKGLKDSRPIAAQCLLGWYG